MAEHHTNGARTRVNWQLVLELMALIGAVLISYGAMNTRVAVVEDRVNRMVEDMKEIKGDVKTLLHRSQP